MTNVIEESTASFVEECRREWKRLRVPNAVANEMAADLAADLREAEAEGASAEELLGNAAFDPRTFAESWARERGLIQPRLGDRLRVRNTVALAGIIAVAIVAVTALLVLGSSKPKTPSVPPQSTSSTPTTTAIAAIAVPNLIGLSQSEASNAARAAGASISIVYVKRKTSHSIVVAEHPAPGTVISRGATLSLTVSR